MSKRLIKVLANHPIRIDGRMAGDAVVAGVTHLAGVLVVILLAGSEIVASDSARQVHVDDLLLVDHYSPEQGEDNLIVSDCKDGTLLASWTEMPLGVRHGYLQRFSVEGAPVGPSIHISSDLEAAGWKYDAGWHDGFLPDRRIVVVHIASIYSPVLGHDRRTSFMQFFDSLGTPLSEPVHLHDTLDILLHWEFHSRGVVIDSTGVITVLYMDTNDGPPEIKQHLYLERFSSSGQSLGPLMHVTDCDGWNCGDAQGESIHTNQHGRVVVAWGAHVPFDTWPTSYFRVYDDGVPVTEPRPFTCGVDSVLSCGDTWDSCFRSTWPYAAIRRDGSFAVSLQGCGEWSDDSGLSYYVQVFDSSAQPVSQLTRMENLASHVVFSVPYIEVDGDSGFVAGWVGFPWHPRADFILQRVSLTGDLIGENYRVNTPIGTVNQTKQWRVVPYGGTYTAVWLDNRDWASYKVDIYLESVPVGKVGVRLIGDINFDSFITSSDIIHLVNYVFKSGDPPYGKPDAGDVNGSCTTSSSDIIYIVNHIFNGGTALQPPCSIQ